MTRLCEGRVAIVTGAGRGIGREHALLLAQHGAKVVVNDLGGSADGTGSDATPAEQTVADIIAMGGQAVVNTDNVADFLGAKRMVDQAIDTFGTLDVLINNAGILRDRVLVNMMEAEWDAVIAVHLKGTFGPSRHAAAYWRNKSKDIGGPVHARIINTSSVSGIYGNTGQTNYGASKGAIIALTKSLAREMAPFGILVNAVNPGLIRTELTADLPEETRRNLLAPTILKREGEPEEVASVVAFLCSDWATYMSGQVVNVDGGLCP